MCLFTLYSNSAVIFNLCDSYSVVCIYIEKITVFKERYKFSKGT